MKNLIYRLTLVGSLIAAVSISAIAQGSAAREYKRLIALRDKLAKIPMERLDREPNKSFIRRNKKDIVYSEPAGQWFVRADRFWALAKKHKANPLADDIAWTAAETPLPGECEGYVNCYLFNANATLGEYLRLYPAGKHKTQALSALVQSIDPLATYADDTYDGPKDASDKAEFEKMLGELRSTLTKVRDGTGDALSLLDKIDARYK